MMRCWSQSSGEGSASTYRIVGDPTEGAMLVAAVKAWKALDELSRSLSTSQRNPLRFSPEADDHRTRDHLD